MTSAPLPSPAPPLHGEDLGSGPAVLLLHSSGLSGRQWQRLARGLAQRGFTARMLDLTGHGASTPWPEPVAFNFRQDVEQIARLLGAHPPAHVVGHSYGALVGLLAAAAAPKHVKSLSLYEPVAFGCLDPSRDGDARAEIDGIDFSWGSTPAEHERWLEAFVDYWGSPGAWKALREEARAEFKRVGWVVQEGVRTLMLDQTPGSAYAGFDFPVRLLTGERSPIAARRVVERLGGFIPGARVTSLAGVGHMGPLSHAEQVNAVIFDLLQSSNSATHPEVP